MINLLLFYFNYFYLIKFFLNMDLIFFLEWINFWVKLDRICFFIIYFNLIILLFINFSALKSQLRPLKLYHFLVVHKGKHFLYEHFFQGVFLFVDLQELKY